MIWYSSLRSLSVLALPLISVLSLQDVGDRGFYPSLDKSIIQNIVSSCTSAFAFLFFFYPLFFPVSTKFPIPSDFITCSKNCCCLFFITFTRLLSLLLFLKLLYNKLFLYIIFGGPFPRTTFPLVKYVLSRFHYMSKLIQADLSTHLVENLLVHPYYFLYFN